MTRKHMACKDVMTGCPFEASADTEQELMETVRVHAARDHGIMEVTPELAAKVKAAIQSR